MRNRFLSDWRHYVLFAVVVSFALTPIFADARDRVQSATGSSQPTQGLQLQETGVENTKQFTRYARSNYVWPFATGPVYGTVTGRDALAAGVLHTRVGALRLADMQGRLPAQLQTIDMLDSSGAQYFIVQVAKDAIAGGGVAELSEMIRSAGGEVVGGMPVNFLQARLTAGSIATVRSLPGVEAVVPFQAAFKLDPMIGRKPLIDPVKAVSEVLELEISLFPGERMEDVVPQLVAIGARMGSASGRFGTVSIHRDKIGQLAGIQAISDITEFHPMLPAGEETTMTMQVGGVGAFGFGRGDTPPYHAAGINGSGNGVGGTAPQTLLVIDSGAQVDAADLSNDDLTAGTPGPGHRKVVSYRAATDFGGDGDFQGCDDPDLGGGTHGHVVAATALGNATNIVNLTTGWNPAVSYVLTEDVNLQEWAVDGVAPGATLALLDANSTPAAGTCDDPTVAGISTGPNYYSGTNLADPCPGTTCPGFLQTFYRDFNAKLSNMSFGSSNMYGSSTRQIDQFLWDKGDAMVFAAAGNNAQDVSPNDGFPDLGSVISPSTNKNGLSIGGSNTGGTGDNAENRYGASSVGPARVDGTTEWETDPIASKDRIQPIVVAPSNDTAGGGGLDGEFVCRSDDNDNIGMVECDRNESNSGTSFGSPAAAGAGLLIRDYFAQGFYPSGAQDSGDAVPNISGALLKALLIASADFLDGGAPTPYRWNNEQGYGRVQLDNVLPLQTWPSSPSGLIVADGGIVGGPNNLSGLDGVIDGTQAGSFDSETFTVVNDDEELRIALVWMDIPVSGDLGQLNTDLDLEVCAPASPACSGKVYYGNYFTDDDDRSKVIDTATEDCPTEQGVTGSLTEGKYSIPRCTRPDGSQSPRDHANNTEAVFLTNDLDEDNNLAVNPDADPSDDTQLVTGDWTVRVKVDDDAGFGPGINAQSTQRYAVVITGGALLEASVQFDSGSYTCNVESTITVNETADLGGGVVSANTTVQVFAADGVTLLDTETNLPMDEDPIAGTTRHTFAPILLSDGTVPTQQNGVLDISDGDTLRVTYNSATDGTKISESTVNCKMRITAGAVTFGQFGYDRAVAFQGGCERNARGLFEFGFPDRYPDEDEQIIISYAFASQEASSIEELNADLRCVEVNDTLAPEDCRSGTQPSASCPNPERLVSCDDTTCLNGAADNMTECSSSWLTITNPNVVIDVLPANTAIGLNYGLLMGSTIPDLQNVEFILEISAPSAGLSGVSRAVVRQTLDADEIRTFYSTDHPTGGMTISDINNNEFLEGCEGNGTVPCTLTNDPTRRQDDFTRDYRFETRSFSDLTAGGANATNVALAANLPWNFDNNDGGLRNGVAAPTDFLAITDQIAQWGEDTNFNNLLDGFCRTRYCLNDITVPCSQNSACAGVGGACAADFLSVGRCGGPGGELCSQFDDPGDADLTPEDCENSVNGLSCELFTCNVNSNCTGVLGAGYLTRCRSDIEDIDPVSNGMLENVWNTDGGCGWQTATAGVCSGGAGACYIDDDCAGAETCDGAGSGTAASRGMWHTGRIGPLDDPACLGIGQTIGQCQSIETVSGETGERLWFELLVTPEISKVSTDPNTEVNIEIFSWNQLMDLEDSNAATTWEIDGDLDSIEPVDLTADGTLMGIAFGGYTPRGGTDGTAQNNPDLTNGYSMFSPVFGINNDSVNGTVGNNRHGRNACYFEGALTTVSIQELGFAGPLDDDQNNGYCPGIRKRPCTALCVSAGGLNGTACTVGQQSETDCINSGGVCSTTDLTVNDCDTTVVCNGSNQCEDVNGDLTGSGCSVAADCYTCTFDNAMIDEYVFANGPIRNMDPTAFNGPDLRFTTVEDVLGESKSRFKAAIGILNFEKADDTVPDPVASYGLGVDDFLFEWAEISLAVDATDCLDGVNGGACASLDTSVGTAFNGSTALDVTVLDTTRGTGSDCNFDGDNTDGDDDTDCDNDGVADVPITAKSENENPGERIFAPCANPSGATCPDGEYTASIPVSATYDSDGVVFVQGQGAQNPVIEINYFDWDDGTGGQCENSIDPLFNGLIQAFTAVSLTGGNVGVTQLLLVDNGDGDAWADTNETIDMRLTVRNNTTVNLNNVVARLASNDPNIDCIINPEVALGLIEADDQSTVGIDEASKTSTGAFTFRIGNVQRTGFCSATTALACSVDGDCPGGETCDAPLQDFNAGFTIYLNADEFDSAQLVQNVTIDLDMDGSGGGTPFEWIEDFDTAVNGGFGKFGIHNMDSTQVPPFGGSDPAEIAGLGGNGGSLANSEDYRCSFADPDDPNSFVFEDPDCYLGINAAHADSIWWEVTTDRAYDGTQSAAYHTPAGGVLGWTTPTGVMEALQMIDPVPLGYKNVCSNDPGIQCTGSGDCGGNDCINAFPRVVWKHQISLMDFRTVNASSAIRSADGGVVHLQLSDSTGTPVGSWIKVDTVANQYDSQREDNYNVCSFDPVDDGNDEDTGFGGPGGPPITDPLDPDYDASAFRDGAGRKIASSSTCFPQFSYTFMGDTDTAFDPTNIGNATQGPGLEGSDTHGGGVGLGTWVESVVDLSRFRGQQARVRMLVSSLKINTTWQAAFNFTISRPGDDGWWVDDVRIKDAITTPATLAADVKANTNGCAVGGAACSNDADCGGNGPCLFPTCGASCNVVTPNLQADPPGALAGPGQVVELSAKTSAADRCAGGVLQFRFFVDGDNSQGPFDGGTNDTLLRNWSENPTILQAPTDDTRYGVDVRCSSLTSCTASAQLPVNVVCPWGRIEGQPGQGNQGGVDPGGNDFDWGYMTEAICVEGDLMDLRSTPANSNAYNHTVNSQGMMSGFMFGVPPASGMQWGLCATEAPTGATGTECNAGMGPWGDSDNDGVPDFNSPRNSASSTLP
jgi:hypothetical protein